MSRSIRLPAFAAAALLAAAIAGCGGGDGKSSGNGGSNGGGRIVDISDFKFKPAQIEVSAGEQVTWRNSDRAQHTATASEGSAQDFDTGTLKKGQEKAVKLTKKGTFAYVCAFHPFMEGKITVK